MFEIVRGPVPVFVTVIVCAALDEPTTMPPKFSAVAERLSPGTVAVPVSETACGLPVALSVRVSTPVRVPETVGVKVTEMVQVAFAAMLAVQPEFVCPKSPVIAMFEIASAAVPVFVTVTVCAALDAPTITLPKLSVVGERERTGAVGFELKFPAPQPTVMTARRAENTATTLAKVWLESTGLDRRLDKKSTSVQRFNGADWKCGYLTGDRAA